LGEKEDISIDEENEKIPYDPIYLTIRPNPNGVQADLLHRAHARKGPNFVIIIFFFDKLPPLVIAKAHLIGIIN
jgi:hypothetical protein